MTKHENDPSGLYDPEESGSMPHAAVEDDGDELVTVYPPEGKASETARALLEAAGDDHHDLVQARDGGFEVPPDVAKKAKLPEADSEPVSTSAATVPADGNSNSSEAPKRPAAKRTAQKAPAKKAAS